MAVWSKSSQQDIYKYGRMDSEFFHPKYLLAEELVNRVNDVRYLGKIGNFIIGPFGSAFHVVNYDSDSKYRYIRGKDVKPFQLLDDDNVYIPEKDYRRLQKYTVQPHDLLISVVGTLGNVAIVPNNERGIFSCKSTVFRNSKIDPYYLLAYFNSSIGKLCLLRHQRGAIQTGLNKDDLRIVPVPIFARNFLNTISETIQEALILNSSSKSFYLEAQKLLEKELGLDKDELSHSISHLSTYHDAIHFNRFDSEYSLPKHLKLKELILTYKNGNEPFLKNIESIRPNFNPMLFPNDNFNYIELSNIKSSLGLVDGIMKVKGRNAPSRAKRIVKTSDIIASAVVGSVDKSALVSEDDDGYLASTGFFHFRSKLYSPEYLLVLIQSKIMTEQLKQEATGGILSSVPNENLRHLIIPKLPTELQIEITELVKKSHQHYKESKVLLKDSIKKVEDLIETGAKPI